MLLRVFVLREVTALRALGSFLKANWKELAQAGRPLSITADGLAQLGFPHVGNEKAAKLYRARDFSTICATLAQHISKAMFAGTERNGRRNEQ